MIRVATWILVVLVFAAGLVFDTDALLELAGGFLWHHAVLVGLTGLVLAAAVIAWRKWPRQGARRRSAPARRAAGAARKPRANGGRKRASTRGAKRA